MGRKAFLIQIDPKTGEYVDRRTFQFNPETIKEANEINFEEITAPGLSHPSFSFVNGKAKRITFAIELDDNDHRVDNGFTKDFIEFLYKFKPEEGVNTFSAPPPIKLAYGSYVINGIVESMEIERKMFSKWEMNTIKAEIRMTILSLPPRVQEGG